MYACLVCILNLNSTLSLQTDVTCVPTIFVPEVIRGCTNAHQAFWFDYTTMYICTLTPHVYKFLCVVQSLEVDANAEACDRIAKQCSSAH